MAPAGPSLTPPGAESAGTPGAGSAGATPPGAESAGTPGAGSAGATPPGAESAGNPGAGSAGATPPREASGIPRRASFRRLLPFLGPYRGRFAGSLGLAVLAALFDAFSLLLLIPFLRSIFDMGAVLPGGGRNPAERLISGVAGAWIRDATGLEALRNICLLVLAVLLLKNLFLYGSRLLAVHVQERVERDMRDAVYARLLRLPLGFFERSKAGQLMARVLTDTRGARGIVSEGLADVVRQLATVAAYLVALFFLSWRLTLLALVLAPVMVGSLRPVLRRLRGRFRHVFEEQGELVSLLQETVAGIRLVKAYGAERFEKARFRRSSDRYTRDLVRTEAVAQLASPLSEVLSAVVALVLIWVGARQVLEAGALGPEQFLAFVTIALRMISPIKAASQFPARAQGALAAADRFLQVIEAPAEPYAFRPMAAAEARAAEFTEEIRFEDVWFAYEPGRPVLRGIDLRVARGELVALVGPSGAGKSTLADLLPRFIEPDRGAVRIDGRKLGEMPLESVRRLLGFVGQETVIFHDTVRANIAYGDPGRSREAVEEAARAAHAHDFIRELPDGYGTLLGDRGVRLSGGQRQRIGIARALLRDPPILVLDEATSSLDAESERLIQRALERLFRSRTVFVIAHRLSTIRGADRIVVLEEGRVAEEGTHEELYALAGAYRRLYELQFAERRASVP